MSTLESVRDLQERMAQSIIGQESVIENLLIALLANGNILMEGLPGLAKTRAVKSLARNMEADFSRIQFTPDLLPSDITGSEVLYSESGQPSFRFEAGPIFANMVLAAQNPIEQEGTYPLPEAQMDRFLMHVYIDYPDEASEARIIRLVRGEESGSSGSG